MGRHQSDGDCEIPRTLQISLGRILATGLFVSYDAVIKGAIKKLIEQLLQLQLGVEFYDVVRKSLPTKKMPEMIARKHQSPRELLKADSFGSAPSSDSPETASDVFFGFLEQPIPKIMVQLSSGAL